MPGPMSAPNGDRRLTVIPFEERSKYKTGKTEKKRKK